MPVAKDLDILMQPVPAATQNVNDRLYPLVVAGDPAARDEMIRANMPLVVSRVAAYLARFPQCRHLRDDLVSQGNVGLVTAVNNMVGTVVPEPNPIGFMSFHIQQALGELMDQEATIRVPKRTYLENKAKGKLIDRPDKEGSASIDDVLKKDGERDPRSIVDLMDELLGCCESPAEREIVRHRAEGRSDLDIANILGIPKTTAYMMRRGIYARFLQRNPEYRGEV
jgi:hypothetical protein